MAAPSATLPVVHLIGSVPLDSADAVFATLGAALPGRLRRMPDGETGIRQDFCGWQYAKMPTKILKPEINPAASGDYDQTSRQHGAAAAAADLTLADFPPTEYDTANIQSYYKFKKLRDAGTIPAGTRFQVCLPTPLNSMAFFVDTSYVDAAEPLYTQRMLEALATIQSSIPKEDLAIQWDMCVEMCHMEHGYGQRDDLVAMAPHYAPVLEGILQRNGPLLAAVDPAVPMGVHLCYGDYGHQHFVEPVDTALLVALANGLQSQLPPGRMLQWVHVPVPKSRTDAAYFQPLRHLTPDPATTDLILGLVHAGDLDGTQARIAAAAAVLGPGRRFGVSTECGLGRTPRAELDDILRICHAVTPAP